MALHLTTADVTALGHAAFALGKLVGTAENLPHPEHLLEMYVRLEAVLSSRIEGTRASVKDLIDFQAGRPLRDAKDDVRQVANHLELLRTLGARPRRRPLTVRELEAAHRILFKGVPGVHSLGKIRKVQNWIGTPWPFQTVVFVPPPPSEVRPAMNDLVEFVNKDTRYPPLVKAAIAHAYFETIHPFVDGNGRVGRFLYHFVLWKEGAIERPLLYLSHFIRANQSEYYACLQRCRDARGLLQLTLFLTRGAEEVALEGAQRSLEVIRACREIEARTRARLGRRAPAALVALQHFYVQPIADVAQVAAWTDLTSKAANDLVAAMSKAGVLKATTTGRRNRRFALQDYLDLFSAFDEEDEPFQETRSA